VWCVDKKNEKKPTADRYIIKKNILYTPPPPSSREREREITWERDTNSVREREGDLMEWEREIHTNAPHRRIKMCHNIFVVCRTHVSSYPFNIISNNTAATDINCTTLWYCYYHYRHHHNDMGVYIRVADVWCAKQLGKNENRFSAPSPVFFFSRNRTNYWRQKYFMRFWKIERHPTIIRDLIICYCSVLHRPIIIHLSNWNAIVISTNN